WGNQVKSLQARYRIIVMDSRGHGHSSRDDKPYGYDLMASDVIALMDFLKIPKVAIVGWSDGAIIGLDIALNHPGRLTKLLAIAARGQPLLVYPGSGAVHLGCAAFPAARKGKVNG